MQRTPLSVPSDLETRRLGWLLVLIVVQFVAAMIVAQAAYPGYSDVTNYISDLGNTATSPLWWVLDSSVVVLGIGMALAAYRLTALLPRGRRSAVGSAFVGLGGVGFVLVGLAPENVNLGVHTLATLLVFGCTVPGLVLWASAMRGAQALPWWGGTSALATSVTMLVFFGLLVVAESSSFLVAAGVGIPGLLERLAIAPLLVWLAVVGIALIRGPTTAVGGP